MWTLPTVPSPRVSGIVSHRMGRAMIRNKVLWTLPTVPNQREDFGVAAELEGQSDRASMW